MSEDELYRPIATAIAALVVAVVYFLITIDQRDPSCALWAGWLAGVISTLALALHWSDVEPLHPFLECTRICLQPNSSPDRPR